MYRIFALDSSCRLYQLSGRGWVQSEGTNFPGLHNARDFLLGRSIPRLPDVVDTYIALVGMTGLIIESFPVLAECEG